MIADFLNYQAQTTKSPLGIEVIKAKGSYVYTKDGKKLLDFVAGVSACPLGHCHPKIVNAIKHQAEQYLHVMVYGECIYEPALTLCKTLSNQLPKSLQTTYLVNSGTEAIEGALKLAKIFTGRREVVAAHNAYHGSTQGSMSIMGKEAQKSGYRPLMPGIKFIRFNHFEDLDLINKNTAAVILETIQGSAGFVTPEKGYLKQVRAQCNRHGALLILDEIQPGFGRTGRLFSYEHFDIIPDILVVGKGMAGGLPIGAFMSSHRIMQRFTEHPKLGHITTFGGHPLIAAAALATLTELLTGNHIALINDKEHRFRSLLIHPHIKSVKGKGLMLAIILQSNINVFTIIEKAIQKGLILFGLLFEKQAIRITPPLNIQNKDIVLGCQILLDVLDEYKTG